MSAALRSKRKRVHMTRRDLEHSALQVQLRTAIESPGGTKKILHLVNRASSDDVEELNRARWSPLVGAIFRLGKDTTRNGNAPGSEGRLMELIRACRRRGICPNSGDVFGAHYHRPLIVAAYFGYPAATRLLVEAGALPGLRDGEGRNAWFAAFQNPACSGGSRRFRDCDRRTAQTLLDLGAATSDLGSWKRSAEESTCYVNQWHAGIGSVMYRALTNKNANAVRFLRDSGGVITDRVYSKLRRLRKVKVLLLPVVREILSSDLAASGNSGPDEVNYQLQQQRNELSWNPQIDWSFPPTWKVGVRLCQNCGLPEDIFRTYVVPFLDRDWFFP